MTQRMDSIDHIAARQTLSALFDGQLTSDVAGEHVPTNTLLVVGPPCSGKTRFAMQSLLAAIKQFGDGNAQWRAGKRHSIMPTRSSARLVRANQPDRSRHSQRWRSGCSRQFDNARVCHFPNCLMVQSRTPCSGAWQPHISHIPPAGTRARPARCSGSILLWMIGRH